MSLVLLQLVAEGTFLEETGWQTPFLEETGSQDAVVGEGVPVGSSGLTEAACSTQHCNFVVTLLPCARRLRR